ncbi:MAG: signal peptidase I [Candidatus Liptonbacteria bacterium]|nr:signal peptidase I [Candidatus Liptonbacteria bacterium]
MRGFLAASLEVLEVALVTVGAVFLIRTFLVQPFLVSGASMVPNFANGDYLLIDELSYRLRAPTRGEVAVFHYPNDESTFFIKRIIGLPGERVAIRDGQVVVSNAEHPQGETLQEPYLPLATQTNPRPGGKNEYELGPDQYFVLGDNRSASFDSREWGVLTRGEIVGLTRIRLWPPKSFQAFAAPQY